MISLFHTEEIHLEKSDLIQRARKIIAQGLNKGLIISERELLRELPQMTDDQNSMIIHYYQEMTQWSRLTHHMRPEMSEYIGHGPNHLQLISVNGRKENISLGVSTDDWQLMLEVISIHFKQTWNMENPFVSFYGNINNQSYRISLMHESLSPESVSKIIIRVISSAIIPLIQYKFCQQIFPLIEEKKNILIAGSTGSGKTTFLSSMLDQTDISDHLLILEDTYEVLYQKNNASRMIADKHENKSLYSYLTYAMRMSPDRIVLGEIRSHEVVPLVMAMNTGHKGLMATIHANNACDAINRIALLFTIYSKNDSINYERVMDLVCQNLDYVVFMENKQIKEIIKVLGCDKGRPYFEKIEINNYTQSLL